MAYSTYIFKALGITSAWGLCRMHPGLSVLTFARIILISVVLTKVYRELQNQFLGGSERKLKKDAVPTIFSQKTGTQSTCYQCSRAAKREASAGDNNISLPFCKIYRGYYMPERGYEFYLRVVNSISHE